MNASVHMNDKTQIIKQTSVLHDMDSVYTLEQEWYDNGNKKLEGKYKDGKKEGKWIYWWKNGDKLYESEYKDGKPEGKWIAWYEDGTKEWEQEFKNGNANGTCINYYNTPLCRVEARGEFKNGKLEGNFERIESKRM